MNQTEKVSYKDQKYARGVPICAACITEDKQLCNLHRAAPEMYSLLQLVMDDEAAYQTFRKEWDEIRAKAEGRE